MEFKIVGISTYSKTSQSVVSDSFFIKMSQSPCVGNAVAFTHNSVQVYAHSYGADEVQNLFYTVGGGDYSKSPLYSTKMTSGDCPLNAKLFL
jgi:hypothetical protein